MHVPGNAVVAAADAGADVVPATATARQMHWSR
jgi:hypothetical protein